MTQQLSAANVTVFESALFRTTSTCVHTDRYLLMVDPNWLPAEVSQLRDFADAQGAKKDRYLLFTHSDYDHIIGYGAFADYRTIASQRFVDNPAAARQLQQAKDWDDEYYISRNYRLSYPTINLPIDGDGTELTLGEDEYVFYQAPGHNYDGLLTFNRSRGLLIVGDYLSNVEFPYLYHSFADYRRTLQKLERLITSGQVTTLVTGHGDATSDRDEMTRRLADSFAYLDGMEHALRSGAEFDFTSFVQQYDFPGIMRKFHDKNLALLRQEMTPRP